VNDRVDFYLKHFQLVNASSRMVLLRVSGLWRAQSRRELGVPLLVVDRGIEGHQRLQPLGGPEDSIPEVDGSGCPWQGAFAVPSDLVDPERGRFALQVEPDVHIDLPVPTVIGGPAPKEDPEPSPEAAPEKARTQPAAAEPEHGPPARVKAKTGPPPAGWPKTPARAQAKTGSPARVQAKTGSPARVQAKRDAPAPAKAAPAPAKATAPPPPTKATAAPSPPTRQVRDPAVDFERAARADAERAAHTFQQAMQDLRVRLRAERAAREEAEGEVERKASELEDVGRALTADREKLQELERRLQAERTARQTAEDRALSEAAERVVAQRAAEARRQTIQELKSRMHADTIRRRRDHTREPDVERRAPDLMTDGHDDAPAPGRPKTQPEEPKAPVGDGNGGRPTA
jgi:hypothetical protein